MNRIVYRSTSFVFAVVMTLGTFKAIALLAAPAPFGQSVIVRPAAEVVAMAPSHAQIAFVVR